MSEMTYSFILLDFSKLDLNISTSQLFVTILRLSVFTFRMMLISGFIAIFHEKDKVSILTAPH
jgi:hypothetical protein